MTEPMNVDRLAEIGEMFADYQRRHSHRGAFACCSAHPVADVVPELLAEVERLRLGARVDGALYRSAESDVTDLITRLERIREQLKGEELNLLAARATSSVRNKKPLDTAARRLRVIADSLDGTGA